MLAERANALIRLGDPSAHDGAYRALIPARASGERDLILDALKFVTAAEVQAGRLHEARRAAEEALAAVAGQGTVEELDCVGLLAWVVALLGDEPRCRELMDLADRRHDELRITDPGGLARGLLALSKGAAAEAVAAFESKLAETRFGPVAAMTGYRPFAADLVEAYARAGRPEDPRRVLASTLPVALGSGQPRLAAPMWRALGIVNDARRRSAGPWASTPNGAIARGGPDAPRHRASCCGGSDVAPRRGTSSPRHWRPSPTSARPSGADRAVAELRLAGERTAAPGALLAPGPESLTRQEAEILELVRAGLSNRAIAERLFLSVKTVEGHLTTIYGKFGVTSRTQILAALARSEHE